MDITESGTLGRWFFLIYLNTVLIATASDSLNAQHVQSSSLPDLYLDCSRCPLDYVRSNVTFVNYVRDYEDADIYLRITDAQTGSGRLYVMDFQGMHPFSTRRDTLTYFSPNTSTSDEERTGLVRYIRIGLIPFLTETAAMQNLDVIYAIPATDDVGEIRAIDRWDHWIFEIGLKTAVDKEETEFNYEVEFDFDIERITETLKIEMELEIDIDRTEIELEEGRRKVNRDSWEFDAFAGYSLGNHFSAGVYAEIGSRRTRNLSLYSQVSPAIEYSFFPYRQFQERRWILRYSIAPFYVNYYRTTIYLQDRAFLLQQLLFSRLRYDQPWGNIDVRLSASSYLHDHSRYSIELNPSFNIRVVRGLSVQLSGLYRIINDQLHIPARDITDLERLLGERRQATSYRFQLSFGFSYVFGSRYSNIVNPRF